MDFPNQPVSWATQPVPLTYLLSTLNVGSDLGLDRDQLLSSFDIQFHNGQTHAPLNQLLAICLKLYEEFPNYPLALKVGQRLPPTAYGNLGVAMLCSATSEECLTIMHRYWKLINLSVTTISIEKDSEFCSATLHTTPWLIEPLRRIWIEASLSSWRRCFDVLYGESLHESEIWLEYESPSALNDNASAVQNLESFGNIRYGMPANQFRVPANVMQRPLPMANPIQIGKAIILCDQECYALERLAGNPMTLSVRQRLVINDGGYPTLEQLADEMQMSVRTLRRQLNREQTGYKQLLEEARRNDAFQLLGDERYKIQHIAELLGFGDPANFAKAFRNWTGKTPREFRKQLKVIDH